ncbi:uncharacterized protein BXZ73DRAFT_106966 [Epithele typhae]|uniref:uncharacterized protein n=1 Tax=Epithele typhae TaxID=378194 RepID=UPI002008856A|nr:uncharacterized protein BXZ73DRAFT_106966 [Epithele typhae]KAH9913318.1 hypothetical protein BXZ73DRAFT_106966 [Epithele typhae]
MLQTPQGLNAQFSVPPPSTPSSATTILKMDPAPDIQNRQRQNTLLTARDVARAMRDDDVYAVVGGAACLIFGSTRLTTDVDIVVLKAPSKSCGLGFETPQTSSSNPEPYTPSICPSTPVVVVDGVKVLAPVPLLDCKCYSVTGRTIEGKKLSDTTDIKFLLQYCARNSIQLQAAALKFLDAELVELLVNDYRFRSSLLLT